MIEQNIFNNDHVTSNSTQLEILKKNFPNCFDKDGHFILDSFKAIIKENDLDFSEESYSLNWLGKSYAQLLRNEKIRTLIRPNHDHNSKEAHKNSRNLLIKGDNLEVLKHLRNAYSEKIKMIYIDPPYNTGLDGFVYQDDRKFTQEELMHLAKVSEDEAKRILDFTNKDSNNHSAWLTFMYPRLYIARQLLREDGVIFISIDDNEQAQLKLLCDEIFGEENFISNFVWRTDGNFDNQAKVKVNHEYILCYSKKLGFSEFPSLVDPNIDETSKLFNDSIVNTIVKNGDKNPISKITLPIGFKANFESGTIIKRNDSFPIFHNDAVVKNGVLTNSVIIESGWSSKRNFELFIKNNLQPTLDTKGQETKYHLTQTGAIESIKVRSIQSHVVSVLMNMGNTQSTSKYLNDALNIPFSFPKPITLISFLAEMVTNENEQDIILDFFAGSGTTAHAVMDLNAEDNGNRQFILVQLPEETDKKSRPYKAGYKNIFEITKIRIEKVEEIIKQNHLEYGGDLGFKIFETTPLPNNYNNEVLKLSLDPQIKMFNGAKNDEKLLTAILTTWTLYDRIPLTTPLEALLIDDYEAQYNSEYNTLYLMQSNFTTQNIKTLICKIETEAKFIPKKIVVYGFNFDSKIQRELDEALRNYQNKKSLNIDLLIRYY